MTEPFQLRRRTPAGQLRYIVDRLDTIDAQSSAQQVTLIACRNLLAGLATELGTAEEVAEADSYAAMVNAPLRPETIAAIAERIKSGDMPVRKVKARESSLGLAKDTALAAERMQMCGPGCRDHHTYDGACQLPPGSPDGRHGYAGESERLPDGSCPDWCPCHRLRAEEQPS